MAPQLPEIGEVCIFGGELVVDLLHLVRRRGVVLGQAGALVLLF